jgi:transketolase
VGASSTIAACLIGRHLLWDLRNPWARFNDTFLYSNGHGPEVIYQCLWRLFPDVVPEHWVKNRCTVGGSPSHPEGIWHDGRPISVLPYRGMSADLAGDVARAPGFVLCDYLRALAEQRDGLQPFRPHVWVMASDGCVAEPEFWGAVHTIGQRGFVNITLIVVDNLSSLSGATFSRYNFSSATSARAAASGWKTYSIFGHRLDEVDETLTLTRRDGGPSLVWARTLSAYGLPDERKARTHGAPITAADLEHALQRFTGDPHADPFQTSDVLEAFCERRRADLARDAALLEGLVPGITKPPSFPIRLRSEGERSSFAELYDIAADDWKTYVPRVFLSQTLLPRAEAVCERRGKTILYITPDIGTSTGCERGKIITPFEPDADARVFDVGANEQGAAHIAEAINSDLTSEFLALESTFLCYNSRSWPAVNNALRRGLPYRAVRSHADKGLGTDGPTHAGDREVTAIRIGMHCFDYVCATPREMAFALSRTIDAIDGAHFVIFPRQDLAIPPADRACGEETLAEGVYAYRRYGSAAPALYVVGSGTGLSMGAELCTRLAAQHGLSTLLLSGFSISLFNARPWADRVATLPKGAKILWIDPVENCNPNVAGMLNTTPDRLIHAGMTSLYWPCLSPDDPALWAFDGLDTDGLVEKALALHAAD